TSDANIQSTLQNIVKAQGEIGAFIHLHPHLRFSGGNFAQHFAAEKAIVKTVFFAAKHIAKSLQALGKTYHRASFLTVTQLDGALGTQNDGKTSIVGGGLFGMTKSLNIEWSSVFCRAVDLSPNFEAETAAKLVMSEMHDPDATVVEVCHNDKGRFTLTTVPTEIPSNENLTTEITKDSVFLVSGGAKGVTATCVKKLAELHQCKFILLGRSSVEGEEPIAFKGVTDAMQLKRLIMQDLKAKGEKPTPTKVGKVFNGLASKREIKDTLATIKASGGQAVYLAANVLNVGELKKAVGQAEQHIGKTTGVIHGAGRLADKLIQNKTEADFEAVYSVKTEGLLALLQCVNPMTLEHLVLFSSVAGFYGNNGQTDYAIANEILNKLAHLFQKNHPNCHVVSIDWGAWDGGMVSPGLKKMFEAHGVQLIPQDAGAWLMAYELSKANKPEAQVVVGSVLPLAQSHIDEHLQAHRIHRKLTVEANPFLQHHVIGGNPVLPIVNAVSWIANSCEQLYPDYKIARVENTRLFKGIVFDGNQATDYVVDVKELEKGKDEIRFEGTVWSQGANGRPTFHYRANVVIRQTADGGRPTVSKRWTTNGGRQTEMDGKQFYTNGTLFHDHYFQGVESILEVNEQGLVMQCYLPEVSAEAQGQFPVRSVNSFLTDIQYQAMLIWVRHFHDAASLPLNTKLVEVFEALPFDTPFKVALEVKSSTPFKMLCDISAFDDSGKVFMRSEGAEVTVSKGLKW
ncbi:MAG: SDR family NAD(P)-dependent oxidoreductase, partial [Chitinophagales bacterium]